MAIPLLLLFRVASKPKHPSTSSPWVISFAVFYVAQFFVFIASERARARSLILCTQPFRMNCYIYCCSASVCTYFPLKLYINRVKFSHSHRRGQDVLDRTQFQLDQDKHSISALKHTRATTWFSHRYSRANILFVRGADNQFRCVCEYECVCRRLLSMCVFWLLWLDLLVFCPEWCSSTDFLGIEEQ